MPFEIVRNDIVNMQVDAIVNTANPRAKSGSGTDAAIHAQAGPELMEARKVIGSIWPGQAAVTPAFDLNARFVIHTVGPQWRGGFFGEEKKLRSCYDASLKLAGDLGCQSIAFPLISAGNNGFPRDKALQIAIDAFRDFLQDHEMQITLVVFDRKTFQLSETLFQSVASFIDEHYVQEKRAEEYSAPRNVREEQRYDYHDCNMDYGYPMGGEAFLGDCCDMGSYPMDGLGYAGHDDADDSWEETGALPNLKDMLQHTDAGFSEMLLRLIDKTGKKDSAIYKKANVSKQHFSKIRNNSHYQPTKATAVAFAIALELDLEQTRDLIGRAGYALTNSSKFDVIIMYFIRSRNYNMFDINSALFEFDQTLLGA